MKLRCVLLAIVVVTLSALCGWWLVRKAAAVKARSSAPAVASPSASHSTAEREANRAIGSASEIARTAANLKPTIAAHDETIARHTRKLAAARHATAQARTDYEQTETQPFVSADNLRVDRADAIQRACAKLAGVGIQCKE